MKRDHPQRILFLFEVMSLAILSVISLPIFVIKANARFANTARCWGLVVAGTDAGVQSFPRDANYVFHILNVHYRFDGIKYLGYDMSYAGVDKQATISNVRDAIRGWLANNSGNNDVIFIFFACHGEGYINNTGQLSNDLCIDGSRGDPVDEGSEIWNATAQEWVGIDEGLDIINDIYWDDDLSTDLATLTYGRLIFSCTSCFSGGLIDDLSTAQ